ncbi:MAG: SLBB domain-containing protein, partial [Saprospiraceae bacterium]
MNCANVPLPPMKVHNSVVTAIRKWHISLILLLLSFFLPVLVFAQNVDPAIQQQAKQALQRRGVDEAAVRAKLLARGIDIDNVKQEQLPALQPTIEAVIKEVEAEKAAQVPAAANTPPSIQPDQPDSTAQVPGKSDPLNGIPVQELVQADMDSLSPVAVYGQQLFRGQSLALFRATEDAKPPDSYVVSTGDQLTVSIFGASQFDSRFEVKKDGYIQPSGMPKIFLKGLRLDQAKALLLSRFSQFYVFRPEQFAVSLSTSRTITVNVFGETKNYGSFTISAVNTAFNALVAAGGPTDLGTVRNISLIRGRTTKRLDVYELMNNPAIQYDYFLENNDIIHVPVAERIVGIRGAINRPFRYELIKGENLVKLIEYAGGLGANAYREIVQVRRFENDRQVLIDVNLKTLLAGKQDFTLLNGDEVIVRTIPSPIENTASITGAVELPGPYSLTETRRVSDLLRKGVLQREARTDLAFLLRIKPNRTTQLIQLDLDRIRAAPGSAVDLALQAEDKLTVYTQSRFTDRSTISISGAVRQPLK